jgi:hypothetical protein
VTCTFNVTVEANIQLGVEVQAPTCGGFPDGSATVTMSGADISGMNILWTDPDHQTTQTATGLSAGVYTVLVIDPGTGCLLTATANVPAASGLAIAVDQVIQPSSTVLTGSIQISVMGGTAPYEFEWTRNGNLFATTEDLANIPVGAYVLNVTDANGCTVWTEEITIGLGNAEQEEEMMVGVDLSDMINIFPSPTTGKFFLDLNLDEPKDVKIEMFDFLGQQVLTTEKDAVKKDKLNYDLTGSPSGKYLVKFTVGGETAVKEFVLTSW